MSRFLGTVLWRGAIETLMFLPPLIVAAEYWFAGPLGWLWILTMPLIYLAGSLNKLLTRNRIVLAYRLLIAMLFGALPATLLSGFSWYTVPAALAGAFFGYRGAEPLDPGDRAQISQVLAPSVLLYFAGSAASGSVDRLSAYSLVWLFAGLAALLIIAFRLNRIMLLSANFNEQSDRSLPAMVLNRNRGLILCFLAASVLLAAAGQIQRGLEWLRRQLQALLALLSSGESAPPPETPPASTPPPEEMLPPPEGEPSMFWKWLEVILMYAVQILLVLAAGWVLYKLFRAAPGLYRLVSRWLMRFSIRNGEAAYTGYIDDIETLQPKKNWRETVRERLTAARLFGEGWSQWTEERRIRYLFRKRFADEARRSGYRYQLSKTPKENMQQISQQPNADMNDRELFDWYERVRYGGETPLEGTADRLGKNK
ncbi:hypothetical protein DNH61_03985 [Paenibacillus sambharensis]|uniref:DUF4129 domain-containing protein n=1 Tax=Paenibacillus sambharensis TaxID=1803190 RepID=A0A2W1LE39_9BACL|nr:DUF4129 domain-containing protein [Paenibacillus sambharensis]PZD97063.1 hypothetical protein DNH61_03985 [Paenibacillus sambharensis]